MVVEIFKTNVASEDLAKEVIDKLSKQFSNYRMNFDLEDCDNILRIESNSLINYQQVIQFGVENNIQIQLVEDL